MIVRDADRRVWLSFRDGRVRKRGPVLGYVSRGRKVGAILAIKRKVVWVPLDEVEIVRSKEK